jgi:hypothetical protein
MSVVVTFAGHGLLADTVGRRPRHTYDGNVVATTTAGNSLTYVTDGGAMAGCLFLVVATSPPATAGLPPFLDTPTFDYRSSAPSNLQGWLFPVAPMVATALGLCLLRWWPYLLAAAGLMAVPGVMARVEPTAGYPWVFGLLPSAGYALAIVALLACAQGLIRTAAGWGAAVAALTLGSQPAVAVRVLRVAQVLLVVVLREDTPR